MAPIAVTLLTGFLGAGKTTLLHHILNEQHGFKIAVIENEFGEVSVDDQLIGDRATQIKTLTNGCICCTRSNELEDALLDLLDNLDQGNDAVQQVALAKDLVREKGLNNRAGVGHAGALDHQTVKVDFPAIAAVEQVEQRVFQLVGTGAADAAVGQGFDLRGAVANQLIVNGDFAKFIFDNGDFKAVLFVKNMAQQGGFTRAKKTGQQGDCNRCHVCLH